MPYYPPALDYAKWILLIAGGACGLLMKPQPEGRRRGYLKLAAYTLACSGALCAGIAGILFNTRAAHFTATGTLARVAVHGGKNSHTDFDLFGPSLHLTRLTLDPETSRLTNGETAQVTYQAESGRVLSIRVLEGPYAGFSQTGSDHIFGSWVVCFVASVLMLYGVVDWMTDGTGKTNNAASNTPQPDGDVDTNSVLKL